MDESPKKLYARTIVVSSKDGRGTAAVLAASSTRPSQLNSSSGRAERSSPELAKFYEELFRAAEEKIGLIDRDALIAIIGFDAGTAKPLHGRIQERKCPTCISCELAVGAEQTPSKAVGRYELMMT